MGSYLFSSLAALGGSYTNWIIPFLFTLTVIVFFHEFGHFLVARYNGIRVLVFSIGFGPELIGFYDRHGTRWKISAIPLGGYVRFLGDENEASAPDAAALAAMSEDDRRHAFPAQPVGVRAAVAAAGPITNFILSILLFAGVFMAYGKTMAIPRVAAVEPGSAGAAAGLEVGDLIIGIDGTKVDNFQDVQRIVNFSPGRPLTIEIERGGVVMTLHATPADKDGRGLLGIRRSDAPGDVKTEPIGLVEAFRLGAERTWSVVDTTFAYLRDVVIGRQSADQISGPIGIAHLAGEVAQISFGALLDFVALLSASIGLLNLFPIPLLDGGHLLFYGIEAARGKPLSERAQMVGFRIGLAIVVMLMIFATFNDLRPHGS